MTTTVVECVECGVPLTLLAGVKGYTFDCWACGMLGFVTETDGTHENFHKYMHRLDPNWPVDGSDTYSLDISEG